MATDIPGNKPFSPAGRPGSFIVTPKPTKDSKAPSVNAPASGPSPADTFIAAGATGTGGAVGLPPAQPHLTYWGGQVLTQPKVVNVFVGDYWKTAQGEGDAAHTNGFVQTFGKAGLFDMLSNEYGAGRPEFAGSVVVAGSPTQMGPQDIQAAVQNALASGQVTAPGDQAIVVVHLPPQAVLSDGTASSTQGLGGYHGSYIAPASGKPVYYAAIAYNDGQNGINFNGNPRDNNTITLSHELVETITDPNVAQAQKMSDLGWYDPQGGEIGDLAVNDGAMPLSEAYGRTADGYAIQMEWDNKRGLFEIAPSKPAKIIKAQGTATPAATLTPAENQSKVAIAKDMNITKLLMDVSLKNPSGVQPLLTLTAPNGTAIPVPVPPTPNYQGTLDLSDFAGGLSSKGDWVLSATDPTTGGSQLVSWTLNATGTAKPAAVP